MSPNSLSQVTSSTDHFTVQLSTTRRGARLARLLTERQLDEWGLPFEGAAHIVAELATESGRGLLIVAAYAERWGVDEAPAGCKTVWAELRPDRGKP